MTQALLYLPISEGLFGLLVAVSELISAVLDCCFSSIPFFSSIPNIPNFFFFALIT